MIADPEGNAWELLAEGCGEADRRPVNDRVYIHGFIDVIGHNRTQYMQHMTANGDDDGARIDDHTGSGRRAVDRQRRRPRDRAARRCGRRGCRRGYRDVGPARRAAAGGRAARSSGARYVERPGTDGPLVDYWVYEDLLPVAEARGHRRRAATATR